MKCQAVSYCENDKQPTNELGPEASFESRLDIKILTYTVDLLIQPINKIVYAEIIDREKKHGSAFKGIFIYICTDILCYIGEAF